MTVLSPPEVQKAWDAYDRAVRQWVTTWLERMQADEPADVVEMFRQAGAIAERRLNWRMN